MNIFKFKVHIEHPKGIGTVNVHTIQPHNKVLATFHLESSIVEQLESDLGTHILAQCLRSTPVRGFLGYCEVTYTQTSAVMFHTAASLVHSIDLLPKSHHGAVYGMLLLTNGYKACTHGLQSLLKELSCQIFEDYECKSCGMVLEFVSPLHRELPGSGLPLVGERGRHITLLVGKQIIPEHSGEHGEILNFTIIIVIFD